MIDFVIPKTRGVRLIQRRHSSRKTIEIYVEATHPKHGVSPKRIYVGTSITCNQARVDNAYKEALNIRKSWLEEVAKEHEAQQKERKCM